MKNLVNFIASILVVTVLSTVSCIPEDAEFEISAGIDQTITLPTSVVVLSGSANAPSDILRSAWTQVRGDPAVIENPNSLETKITGLTTAGVREFRLTVKYDHGFEGSDEVTITVVDPEGPSNQPPVANAGPDQTITLPISAVNLLGSATDPDGTISSYAWSQVGGTQAVIASPSTASTNITGLTTPGERRFRLTVTDNRGATGTDEVTITVNSATPQTDSNRFRISSNEYRVFRTSKNAEEFNVIDISRGQSLLFTFFNNGSLPSTNSSKSYKVLNAIANSDEVRVRALNTVSSIGRSYFPTGTDNVVATVEDRNGKLYITLPKTVVKHNASSDTLHISANVNECDRDPCYN